MWYNYTNQKEFKNQTVEWCRYRGYYEKPSESANSTVPFEPTYKYYHIQAARLAFVAVFEVHRSVYERSFTYFLSEWVWLTGIFLFCWWWAAFGVCVDGCDGLCNSGCSARNQRTNPTRKIVGDRGPLWERPGAAKAWVGDPHTWPRWRE